MIYYSATLVPEYRCDEEPVKGRWLRRTVGYYCGRCGERRDTSLRVQRCPLGQVHGERDAARGAVEGLARVFEARESPVPWDQVRLRLDFDVDFLAYRMVACVREEEA